MRDGSPQPNQGTTFEHNTNADSESIIKAESDVHRPVLVHEDVSSNQKIDGTPPEQEERDQHTTEEAEQQGPAPEAQRTAAETTAVMLALASSLFLAALDMTIITTAVPTISSELNSSAGYIWIGSAYLLGVASFIPTWGKVSDIFGRKTILLCAVAVFLVGSALCGASVSMPMLIASRAVQGVGAGALMVLPNVAISDLFSQRKRSKYLGMLGGMISTLSLRPKLMGIYQTSRLGGCFRCWSIDRWRLC